MSEPQSPNPIPGFVRRILLLAEVAKAPLCLTTALSAGLGFWGAAGRLSLELVPAAAGVFLLACGAAALNSLQEISLDRCYRRTSGRALVTGTLSVSTARWLALSCGILGLVLLAGGYLRVGPAAAGMAAVFFYNLGYTPLKRVSELAFIPGGIAGALPLYIGWLAGGGAPLDPVAWAFMAMFFLWQLPHFCLILLEHADDYRRQGRIRTFVTRFSRSSLKRIMVVWLAAFGCVVLFPTTVPGLLPLEVRLLLAIGTPVFLAVFGYLLVGTERPPFRGLFVSLNTFFFTILTLQIAAAAIS